MICIHPTVTHNIATLSELQLKTGHRVAFGNSYLRLVALGSPDPKIITPKRTKQSAPSTWNDGGDAA